MNKLGRGPLGDATYQISIVQAANWIKKGWCHFHFCFILQLKTNNGEIRQCGSV